MRTTPLLVLLLAAALGLTEAPQAQTLGRLTDRQVTPGGGYYVNALPGEATIRVALWGYVARPGLYEVGEGFDLTDVLSFAGGPVPLDAADTNLKLDLLVFRDGRRIYASSIDRVATGEGDLPAIRDGDIIELMPDRSIRVNVWGTVQDPGLKVLGPGDTIRSAISQAGGPTLAALRGSGSRDVHLRVTQSGTGTVLYDGLLYELPDTVNEAALGDGDVLAVEVRERAGWEFRDTLTVAGIALSAVIAVTQIISVLGSN